MDYRTKKDPLAIDCLILSRYFHPLADELSRRATFLALGLEKGGVSVRIASPYSTPSFDHTVIAHDYIDLAPESFASTPFWRWGPRRWAQELTQWPDPDKAWSDQIEYSFLESDTLFAKFILVSTPSESVLGAGLKLADKFGCKIVCDIGRSWRQSLLRPNRAVLFRREFEKKWFSDRLRKVSLITVASEVIRDEIYQDFGLESEVWADDGQGFDQEILALRPDTNLHLGLTSLGFGSRTGGDFKAELCRFESAAYKRSDLVLHVSGFLSHSERQAIISSPVASMIVHYGPLDAVMAQRLRQSVDYQLQEVRDYEFAGLTKLKIELSPDGLNKFNVPKSVLALKP